MVLQAASDWALRRLLKVVLKKHLKHMLATELDVEQLRVSLGTGALELTDVLLSPQWLAEQAPPGLEVASALVGRLALSVAVTSLTCALQLEDVLVTVRPSSGSSTAARLAPIAPQPDMADAGPVGPDGAARGSAGPGIDDGVRLVAAGVETLLQRLSVTVARLTIRVEGEQAAAAGAGGSGGAVATLSCAQICYGAAPGGPEPEAAPQLQHPGCPAAATARRLAFSGLRLGVQQGGPLLLAPLSGEAEVTVTWPLDGMPGHSAHVAVAASLEAVQLQLRPPDVVALLSLARRYSAASARALLLLEQQQAGAAAGGQLAAAAQQQWQAAVGQQLGTAAGHASFLDDLMLPGFPEAAVHDALLEGAAGITGQEEVDEFFDSKSLLGSLQDAFSSAMSASLYASAAPGASTLHGGLASRTGSTGAGTGAGPAGGGDLGGILAMHDLAASIRETGGARRKRWTCALTLPALTLTLLYPEGPGCASQHFAPRLVAEALDLSLRAESGEASGSGSGGGSSGSGSSMLSATVRVVEVAEHLPFPVATSPASSVASCAAAWAGGWAPAEEMARVPAVLPAAQHIRWAAPTFAGDYPLPDEPASGGALDSTLAQLTDLSQATVYMSAAAGLEGSIMMSSGCQGAAALPRVQIVPVLRCGGLEGAAMVLLCTLDGQQQQQQQQLGEGGSGDASVGPDVALMLQPVSLWCTLPLLAHLQSFVEPVASQLAATQAATPGAASPEAAAALQGDSSCAKAAVAAAISDILREQQAQQQAEAQAQRPVSAVRLSLYLPAVCVLAAVPGALPPGLPKYFAADVRGSSSQLLASMAPRLGSQQPKALLASLRSSGVQPTLELQQGSGSGCLWQATLRTASLAVHAVAEAGAQLGVGESVLGPGLATTQVACIEGSSDGGLGLDARWCQQANAPPGAADGLWVAAAQDPDCLPEHAVLQQRLCAGARLQLTASSRAAVQLTLQHTTLDAAGRLADGLLQLSTAPPPVEAAAQATVLLECDVECTLVVPNGPSFTLTARSVHVAASSSMAGVAGSSIVAVAVSSLELTQPDASSGSRSQLLVHAAGQQLADGQRRPALQLLVPLRPTGEACVLCNNGRYVLPCEGRISAAVAGLTLLLDEGGQLGWAADLRAFAPPSDAASSGAGDASLPPPPAPTLDVAVCLLSFAVRYEPHDTRKAAAVLSAAAVNWQWPSDTRNGSSIEARKLALHVAGPARSRRNGSSSGSNGRHSADGVQNGLAWSESAAGVAGFHQVAAETGISVQLPPPPQQQHSGRQPQQGSPRSQQHSSQQPPAAAQQAVQEVAVTNCGLSVTLSRHTLLLLRKLAHQLPNSSGSSDSGRQRAAAADGLSGSSEFVREAAAGSLAGSASGDSSPAAAVNVMQGVMQSAYARPQQPAEHPLEASVFLDGGWYDPQQGGGPSSRYVMSPAGSPPAVLDSFMEEAAPGSRHAGEQEGQGTWYGGGAQVWDEYEALQAPEEEEASTCFGSSGFDCLALPPDHPQPLRRLSLRNIGITVTLADTFTTVLLPEDVAGSSSEEEEWGIRQPGSPGSAAAGQGSAQAARRREASEEEELVPLSAQVQARLEGLCLQLDSFNEDSATGDGCSGSGSGGGAADASCPTRTRVALAVRHLEVRDSFQPRQGTGGGAGGGNAPAAAVAAAGAAATGWADLRRMLGYHASLHRARGPKAAMVQVVAEGVCAQPGADLDWRLQVQLLPLLVHLDQAALAFLQHIFAPDEEGEGEGIPPQDGAGSEAAQPAAGPPLYIQRCEVQPFTLTLHYRPHRVDLAALSSGQLSEVLNLVPWGGISLQFRHLRLLGMPGLAGLGTAAASAYVEDIARHQAGAFVSGIAPIASICRVSAAAAQLLAIPRAALYQRASDGSGGLSLAALADKDFRRQMQRGLAGLVRAVALEACNLGATVAAGAEVALAGEASASHTAGVKKALRQASAHLRSSSSGPRTAASAAATAVRTALLGVRNTLDREHTLERRLNQ